MFPTALLIRVLGLIDDGLQEETMDELSRALFLGSVSDWVSASTMFRTVFFLVAGENSVGFMAFYMCMIFITERRLMYWVTNSYASVVW